jgi:hypothetical protein
MHWMRRYGLSAMFAAIVVAVWLANWLAWRAGAASVAAIRDPDYDAEVKICDEVVERLLDTSSMTELERMKVIIQNINCDIGRRMLKRRGYPHNEVSGDTPD